MGKNSRKFRVIDITYGAVFVALMAIGANIISWLPFLKVGNVPLSMQPFFAILAGLLLGSRVGSLSMVVYALVGIAGLPVFAEFKSGLPVLMLPTGGFIISYIFVAYFAGKIVERKEQPTLSTFMIASFVGIILVYMIGTNYMYLSINTWTGAEIGYSAAWKTMIFFAIKDFVFTIIAAMIAPRIYHLVNNTKSTPTYNKAM
ncbi:biotin transporter BioY [Cytobacillus sp. IB215316]|uniref:biotin transporter BioY n=1 Tax=Cytobacillus sp. IB215316 TaxID=3097354 RepID=UPI002A0D1D3C|nr:biotin transporter BioY [Cytobacillus sp. IB215316]MDX8361688.1 biotin transporter BioY [Cytobacillus sp. IB215316]